MNKKKLYNVAVLGATGAVGQEMIKVLAERNFPLGSSACLQAHAVRVKPCAAERANS